MDTNSMSMNTNFTACPTLVRDVLSSMFYSRKQPPLCPTSSYCRLPILTDDDTVSPGSCVWECSSTHEILPHQGVHAHGSLALDASCPVRIAKKYNVAASSCMGFQTPPTQEKTFVPFIFFSSSFLGYQ